MYKFFRYTTIPCPNCTTCKEHRQPRLIVGRRFYRRNDDATETPLTQEEYESEDGWRG